MTELSNDFQELLNSIIEDKVNQILAEKGIYQTTSGKITKINSDGTYNVDIGNTELYNVLNQSAFRLNQNDTVSVSMKSGSGYTNNYIGGKNANSNNGLPQMGNATTLDEMKEGQLTFYKDTNNNSYKLGIKDGDTVRYITLSE